MMYNEEIFPRLPDGSGNEKQTFAPRPMILQMLRGGLAWVAALALLVTNGPAGAACLAPPTETVSGSATINGGSSATITLSSSQGGVTYQLYANGSASGGAQAGTGSALTWSVSPASTTTYTVETIAAGGYCATGMSGSAVVTVNSTTPALETVSGSTAVCGGSSATVTMSPSQSGVTYQLYSNSIAVPSGTTNGTGSALTWIISPVSTTTYTVETTTAGGYSAITMNGSAVVTVNPTPNQTITPAATSVAALSAGNTASVPATSGATYQWSIVNGAIMAGGTSSTVTYTAGTVNPLTLSCLVTSSSGCASAGGQNTSVTVNSTIPPGAAALGYTKEVINDDPTPADVAPYPIYSGNYKWFRGLWFDGVQNNSYISATNGVLAITLGGEMQAAPHDWSTGALPVLPGTNGFYVEFVYWLSDNNSDHWPAVWMDTVEHATGQDVYAGEPAGYEQWMELDVQEGGFSAGLTGTSHYWYGIYPNYGNDQNGNNETGPAIDQTKPHIWGASYNPTNSTVTWWVDGVEQMSSTGQASGVPAVAAMQHDVLIINAASHGAQTPYTMYVSEVRAFVPPNSPLPSVAGGANPTISAPLSTPGSVCAGTPVSLMVTVNGGNSPTGYVQFFNNGNSLGSNTLSGASATLTGVSLPAGIYTNITAKYLGDANNNPCTSSAGSVTFSALPATSGISGSSVVCASEAGATYSVTGTSGSSYGWTVPGGATITAGASGPNNNQITVTFGSTSGNIGVTETNLSGCAGTPQTLAVTVNALPTVSVNSPTVCSGRPATLTATTSANNPGFLWSPGGATSASITELPSATTSYSVTVTDGTTGCANSGSGTVTVNPLPATSGISGSSSVSTHQAGVTYSVTGTSGSSYAWTVPSDATITAGGTGPNNSQITVTFGSTSGTVGVTETNPSGCAGTPQTMEVTVGGGAPTTRLTASLSGNTLTINWSGTQILELASNVTGPWTPVTTNTGPYLINVTNQPQQFYRCLVP